MYPSGRDRKEDYLGVFLNCVTAPGEATFGWQRGRVKFSLQLVNLLDPAKSVVKGACFAVCTRFECFDVKACGYA